MMEARSISGSPSSVARVLRRRRRVAFIESVRRRFRFEAMRKLLRLAKLVVSSGRHFESPGTVPSPSVDCSSARIHSLEKTHGHFCASVMSANSVLPPAAPHNALHTKGRFCKSKFLGRARTRSVRSSHDFYILLKWGSSIPQRPSLAGSSDLHAILRRASELATCSFSTNVA